MTNDLDDLFDDLLDFAPPKESAETIESDSFVEYDIESLQEQGGKLLFGISPRIDFIKADMIRSDFHTYLSFLSATPVIFTDNDEVCEATIWFDNNVTLDISRVGVSIVDKGMGLYKYQLMWYHDEEDTTIKVTIVQ